MIHSKVIREGALHQLPKPITDKTGWPWTEETNPNLFSKTTTYPKITIVTPSYNQGQFLEETIRSVLLQNYPNLEYIIIDGGSTDNSIAIIKKYTPWLTYWVSEKDRGQSHAINKGFEHSTGRWLNWINSDDYFLKNAFWNVFHHQNLINKEIIITSGLIVNEAGTTQSIKKAQYLDFNTLVRWGTVPNQPSVFFSKAMYVNIGIKEHLHFTMDWRFWLDIAKNIKKENQLIINDFAVASSRIWSGIKTKHGTFTKGYQEVLDTLNDYNNSIPSKRVPSIKKAIFDKRLVFTSNQKEKLIFHWEGLKKYQELKYLIGLIKSMWSKFR